MIEKMRKYTFLIHHSDYLPFLTELQKLGMVHIVKNSKEKSEKLLETHQEIEAYSNAINFLKKFVTKDSVKQETDLAALELRHQLDINHQEKDRIQLQYNILAKEITDLSPWGIFNYDLFNGLEKSGLKLDLYYCSRHHFNPGWKETCALQEINSIGHTVYFAVLHNADEICQIEAEHFKLPPRPLFELKKQETRIATSLQEINAYYEQTSLTAIDLFSAEIERLSHAYEFEDAHLQSTPEADNQVMILRGWIPKRLEADLLDFIEKQNVVHFAIDGVIEDNPPILLKNNWFAKIFEPIGNMFMLPYYNELDLTPFLAPFYMMFFGFCSGDMGYGIVIFFIGMFLKKKFKNPTMRPFLTLIQFLGIGAFIMGFVMGNFFSYDLKTIGFLNPYIPIRNTNQIFNFALLLGVIQIITGKILNGVKQMIQGGFKNGIAQFGITLIVLCLAIMGSTMLGAKPGNILKYLPYGIYFGLFMVVFFNSPGKSIIFNIANSIWVMYGVVTGFFGDLLSYIRLFALGVSGGILGLVVNSMATQLLGIKFLGPVLFIVFLLAGHSLNIALSSLGAFVHPMRLTFVEFFNNSGFSGPGIAYKPFGKQNQVIK